MAVGVARSLSCDDLIIQNYVISPLISLAIRHKDEVVPILASLITCIALRYFVSCYDVKAIAEKETDLKCLTQLCEGYKGSLEDLPRFKEAVDRALVRNPYLGSVTGGAYRLLFKVEQKV